MNCIEEIVRKISMRGEFTEENLRIVLHDYDIARKSTELAIVSDDNRQKAIQMFIVTKKVEGCTDRTIQYYMHVLRHFFNDMDCRIGEISSDQIRYYLAIRSTRDKLSKTSQDNELRVLKSFFKWCCGEDYITKNPCANIKAVKKEKRIKRPFTETELELIRKAAWTKRDTAIIEVLYSTGMRISELCGMNRQDISGDEATVFGKGEKERIVYLNARARIALQEYLDERGDEHEALFVGERTKERISSGGVEQRIRQIGERAGVSKCHPHRFRRTAATIALNRGMPIEQVQQMLGHEEIGTTTIYAKSEQRNVKDSHRKYVI